MIRASGEQVRHAKRSRPLVARSRDAARRRTTPPASGGARSQRSADDHLHLGHDGAPKGIVHSHIGFLLKAAIDFGYAFDLQPGDMLGWIADMGWMLGPLMILGGLQCGCRPRDGRGSARPSRRSIACGSIVERNGVTLLGIAPTAARGLRARSDGASSDRGSFEPARIRIDRRSLGRSDLALAVRDGRREAPADPQLHRRHRDRWRHPVVLHDRAAVAGIVRRTVARHGCRCARCRWASRRPRSASWSCATPGWA